MKLIKALSLIKFGH